MAKRKDFVDKSFFLHPGNRYRIHFMSHNLAARGDMEQYVDEMAQKGVGGFVVNYPMGEDYFTDNAVWEKLNKTVDYIKGKGLIVWIYDEHGFPSGTAGGLTLRANPDYEALGIVLVKTDDSLQIPSELKEVIYSFKDGGDTFAVCTKNLYEGTAASHNYKRRYLNIADKHAVKEFINNTYALYQEKLGDLRGRVDAFFTDEPSLMETYLDEGPFPYAPVSWAYGLEKRFLEMHGYDLMPKVRALFAGDDTEARIVRINYRETLASFVADAFFGQIANWCDERGLKLSGHVENEPVITEHVAAYGNLFTTFDKTGWLGIDALRGTVPLFFEPPWYDFMGAKYVGSLARIRNKSDTVMVEFCPLEHLLDLEHLMTDEQYRSVCNIMWMCGQNYMNSYRQAENFEDLKAFSDYIGRMGTVLHGAIHDSGIAVYYPVETVQAFYKPKHTTVKEYRDDNTETGKYEKMLRDLTLEIWKHGHDFDFVDAEAIRGAHILDGALKIAGMRFFVLVMCGVQALPLDAADKIERFERSGGRVIWLNSLPRHGVTFSQTDHIRAYADTKKISKGIKGELDAAFKGHSKWASDRELLISRFKKDNCTLYMLINNNDTDAHVQGDIKGSASFEIYEPLTGDILKPDTCSLTIKRYSAVFVRVLQN